MTQSGWIRLLLADDHPLVCGGIAALLTDTPIQVVATVHDGAAALQRAMRGDVDVVLMDVRMPAGDGLTALGRIKLERPALPVVMISVFENAASVARAVALGASGFLEKSCQRAQLIDTLTRAAAGETLFSRKELRRVSRSLATPCSTVAGHVLITAREGEILRHLASGLTNQQIAARLKIGIETTREQIQRILRKTGLDDRTQIAVWAVRQGLA